MSSNIRIFIADDHAVVREGLKTLINAQPDMEVVGEAEEGTSVADSVASSASDVAVVDISMPGFNGIEVTTQLKQSAPQIKVLTLTVHEDMGYLRQCLAAGASGYVLKRAAAAELVDAIRTVASGGMYVDPAVGGRLLAGTSQDQAPSPVAHGVELSEREEQVLRLIAQGYSTKEIASQLKLSSKTIETYKARSVEKLGLFSRVDIVRYALQRGWLQEP